VGDRPAPGDDCKAIRTEHEEPGQAYVGEWLTRLDQLAELAR
jgi:hypothetical protein